MLLSIAKIIFVIVLMVKQIIAYHSIGAALIMGALAYTGLTIVQIIWELQRGADLVGRLISTGICSFIAAAFLTLGLASIIEKNHVIFIIIMIVATLLCLLRDAAKFFGFSGE